MIDRPWVIRIGSRSVFEPGVWLKVVADNATISIGERVFIGRGTEIGVLREVRIGDDTLVGPGVFISDHNHGMAPGVPMNQQRCVPKPVSIGRDVWLGAGVIVLPGVSIGDGCVVGAGAVVTEDLPDGAVAVGVPARVVGSRHSK